MPRKAKAGCRRERYVTVTYTRRQKGPYLMTVYQKGDGPWEWVLMEDEEILSEGSSSTEEEAKRAVEQMADDAAQIAAGNWFPREAHH